MVEKCAESGFPHDPAAVIIEIRPEEPLGDPETQQCKSRDSDASQDRPSLPDAEPHHEKNAKRGNGGEQHSPGAGKEHRRGEKEDPPRCFRKPKTAGLAVPKKPRAAEDGCCGEKFREIVRVVEGPAGAEVSPVKPLEQGDSYLRERERGHGEENRVPRLYGIPAEKEDRPGEENNGERDVHCMLEGDPKVGGGQRMPCRKKDESTNQKGVQSNDPDRIGPQSPEKQNGSPEPSHS
jgi:hypothetical protein